MPQAVLGGRAARGLAERHHALGKLRGLSRAVLAGIDFLSSGPCQAPCNVLYVHGPCAIPAGKELVVWRDAEGQWRCFQDKCPHRCAGLQRILTLSYAQNPNLSIVLACRQAPWVHYAACCRFC